MKTSRLLAPVLGGVLCLTGLPVLADADGTWELEKRRIPVPAAASDALQEAIRVTPQPDVAASNARGEMDNESWIASIKARDEAVAPAALALADRFSVSVRRETIDGVKVHWLTPAEIDPVHKDHIFVFLHGGGYVAFAGDSGIREGIVIAGRIGIPVVSVDYRMAPSHPFPAAVEDAVAVYKHVLKDRDAKTVAMGGTSAGGGLTLAVVHKSIALGLEVPGALYAGTPWADLTKTGDTQFSFEGLDRILVSYEGLLKKAALSYVGDHDLKNPLISPVYGSFDGFPPTYLVTGTRDMFLSDTARTHRKMRQAGVIADLNVWEGLSHADYNIVLDSPESKEVYAELGRFLKTHLKK